MTLGYLGEVGGMEGDYSPKLVYEGWSFSFGLGLHCACVRLLHTHAVTHCGMVGGSVLQLDTFLGKVGIDYRSKCTMCCSKEGI